MYPNKQSRASLLLYSRCLLPPLPRKVRTRRRLLLNLPRLHPLHRGYLVLQVLRTNQLNLNPLHQPREVRFPISLVIKVLLLLLLSLPLRTRHLRSTSLRLRPVLIPRLNQHHHRLLSPLAPNQALQYLAMVIRRKKNLPSLFLAQTL